MNIQLFLSNLFQKKPWVYDEWHKLIDDLLKQNQEFANTNKDCREILTDKPVNERYEMSDEMLGPLNNCGHTAHKK